MKKGTEEERFIALGEGVCARVQHGDVGNSDFRARKERVVWNFYARKFIVRRRRRRKIGSVKSRFGSRSAV